MSHTSSHSVTVGAALSYNQGATWSASGTNTTTTGVSFTWAKKTTDRYFDVQIQYGKYANNCGAPYPFRAITPSGGYRERAISYNPSWTTCVSVGIGTWSRTLTSGNTYQVSAGVQSAPVISINLSMNTNYGSTRILYYEQTVTRHLCGSNGVPALAGRIEGEA